MIPSDSYRVKIVFTGQLSVVLGSLKCSTVSHRGLIPLVDCKGFPYSLIFAFFLSGGVTVYGNLI